MEHTKGPWRVREGALFKEGTNEVNPNLPQITCQHCKKTAAYNDGSPRYEPAKISIDAKGWGVAQLATLDPVREFEQHMANARLIAAAPDLLAALDFYVSICGNTAHSVTRESAQEAYAAATAAINKARGVK